MTAVPPDVGELRRLEAAATSGEWWATDALDEGDDPAFGVAVNRDDCPDDCAVVVATPGDGGFMIEPTNREADVALIAALRNSARWLLGQAEAAQRARAVLAALESSVAEVAPMVPTIDPRAVIEKLRAALEGDPDATG